MRKRWQLPLSVTAVYANDYDTRYIVEAILRPSSRASSNTTMKTAAGTMRTKKGDIISLMMNESKTIWTFYTIW